MKKKMFIAIGMFAIIIIAMIFLWRIPIYVQLHKIDVPENSQEVKTVIRLSDAHELHIEGMRIVRCDDGYNIVKEYAQANNSEKELEKIKILPFFADYEFNSDYYLQVDDKDKDKYILIRYYKSLQ